MIIVLNGPLGVGKSTLAEALTEKIESCVMLDGDQLVAGNPPPADELEYLHSTIALLVAHHRRFGYRHFVVDHVWRSPADLADLRRRLMAIDAQAEIRCFLLTLPADENRRRIERRRGARALDEQESERRTFVEERAALTKQSGLELGEPFDVSAPPSELVASMLRRLARPSPDQAAWGMRPRIDAVQPVLMSRDVPASIRFYERLDFVRAFCDDMENPRYAAVRRDDVELHLQWHDAKEWAGAGDRPTYRFVVGDVDGLHRDFREAGVHENIKPVSETSWGTREFHVRDPDGNGLQFYRSV